MRDGPATHPTGERVVGIDLHLGELPDSGKGAALEAALRDAVRSGRLAPSARLPGTRTLAVDLGVARGTVVSAYGQLIAEGWLVGAAGSGTRVAAAAAGQASDGRRTGVVDRSSPPRPDVDLRPGRPDLSAFPRDAWVGGLRRVLAAASPPTLDYGDLAGLPYVRQTIAAYLRRTRGVVASHDSVVLTAGVSHGLALVSRALAAVGVRQIGVEAPGLGKHRALLRGGGHTLLPLRVGIDGARLADVDDHTGAVLLTPGHQHPRGVALAAAARAEFIDWSRVRDGWLIEDDYDGEFRYDQHPLGAMQARDPERVVYLGSASKALAPGLRLGWLVLPPALREPVRAELTASGVTIPVLDQLTLADLIERGEYDRQIRRMRLSYRRRRAELAAALAGVTTVGLEGESAGLHALLPLASHAAEQALLLAADRNGVRLHGLHADGYWPESVADGAPAALVIGYATPAGHGWRRAMHQLTHLIAAAGPAVAPWADR